MRIFVSTDQMAIGGAGRVASILINGLIKMGNEVALETDLDKPILYQVSKEVKIYQNMHKLGRIKRIASHRRYIKEYHPDVIIAFLPPMFLDIWLATIGMSIPIIASDHTSMGRDLGFFTNFLRHKFYSFANAVTILTQKDAKILGNRIPKKQIIYNPLTFEPISNITDYNRRKNILVAGRLQHWRVKGIDRIIKIWSNLQNDFSDWTLEIAGPSDKQSLSTIKSMIENANVSSHVKLLGNVSDMASLYKESSIFALPSRVEGFPMVLTEAMSQGCACVSFDMESAIYEIIDNGQNGIIVDDNDEKGFEHALRNIMKDDRLRESLSKAGIEKSKSFSTPIFLDNWQKLLHNVTKS